VVSCNVNEFFYKMLSDEKLTENKLKENVASDLNNWQKNKLKLEVPYYDAIILRAYAKDARNATEANTNEASEKVAPTADDKNWKKVHDIVNNRVVPKIPLYTMGEICMEAGNKELAIQAVKREPNYVTKIEMLIDIEAWVEAV